MSATYCHRFSYSLPANSSLHDDIQQLAQRAQLNSACLRFDVLQQAGQDKDYVIYEVWQSQAAYEQFHQAQVNQAVLAQLHRCATPTSSTCMDIAALGTGKAPKPRTWDAYLWICFAMCVGVMGTALVSPLYPLYQELWDLTPGDITILYVLYMGSALASLLFLGRLSDLKGYLLILRLALLMMTSGILLSAFAWNLGSFMISRILIGLASSMIVTSASLGLSQLNRTGDVQRAAASTTLMLAFGFGLGPVVGGIIGQWAPAPLFTSYIPSLTLGVLAMYALYKIKVPPIIAHKELDGWRNYLPKLTLPTAALRKPFFLGCLAACAAFSMFSLYASLAPSFMRDMVPWHGPVVSGISIGMILFLSSGIQLLARKLHSKYCVLIGLTAFMLASLSLWKNIGASSGVLFTASVLLTAVGHGLCMLGGMMVVNKVAPAHLRAGMTSTYLIIGYLGAIVPTLSLGWLADHLGLNPALNIYCLTVALCTFGLALLVWRTPLIPAHLLPGAPAAKAESAHAE